MEPIVLCHANEDKREVWRVYDALQMADFEACLDLESLADEPNMAHQLRKTACMLVFLSKNSVRKIGTLDHVFGQIVETWKELTANAPHTILLRINDCQIPDLFSRLHHIDLFEDNGLEHVIHRLHEERAQWKPSALGVDAQAKEDETEDDVLGRFHAAAYDDRGDVVRVPETFSDPNLHSASLAASLAKALEDDVRVEHQRPNKRR